MTEVNKAGCSDPGLCAVRGDQRSPCVSVREPEEKVSRKKPPQQWPPAKALMSIWRHCTLKKSGLRRKALS